MAAIPSLSQRLGADGPKRILSLDGGGIRGIISAALLQRVEQIIKLRVGGGDEFRLAHYFDLIGGTSTGAIIATLLAKGWSVDEIIKVYRGRGPKIFGKKNWLPLRAPKIDDRELNDVLSEILGESSFADESIRTGLAIFVQRSDIGSGEVYHNHPGADSGHLFRPGRKKRRDFLIRDVVRGSVAAPYYFSPHIVKIDRADATGIDEQLIFTDGAVAGVNNPSFNLLHMATSAHWPYGWSPGSEKIFILSVGAGWRRNVFFNADFMNKLNLSRSLLLFGDLVQNTGLNVLQTMYSISATPRCYFPYPQQEMFASGPVAVPPYATFMRLDARLEHEDVISAGVLEMKRQQVYSLSEKVVELDQNDPAVIDKMYQIGLDWSGKIKDKDIPDSFDAIPVSYGEVMREPMVTPPAPVSPET